MANINFKYDYPYCGYGEKGRFKNQWANGQIKLNGCYTTSMVFNGTVPNINHIKIDVEVENTGSGTIYGISWDFMVRKSNGSWVDILSFTMPGDGKYTIDCDVPNYSITQFAVVPSSNPGSSRTWTNWYNVTQMTITENVPLQELTTGMFHYGVFTNQYGICQDITELKVNIDGALKPVTDVLANIDGTLVPTPRVHSAYLKTSSEGISIYSYTVPTTGKYKIQVKRLSGDHEIRLYDSGFTPLYDGYFYSQSFDFTAGTLLYISLTHYYSADESESYLQIYKEDKSLWEN